jgi:pimeloyl-ACP methyl ester carboxylesterase
MKIAVDLGDGPLDAYAYTGGRPFDPKLPCVAFIHGALHDHSVWTLLARSFAAHGHSVLAVDLPGHGRSAGPPLGSVEAIADWLIALLGAAGVGRVRVVGHSMGSLIGLEVAARAADRVDHLAMLATAYPMTVSAKLLDTARTAPLEAIDLVNAYSIGSMAAKPSFPGPGAWLHGSNRALARRMLALAPGNLFLHDFEVCNDYAGGFEAAARVRCPVTLILGERDRMTATGDADALAAALRARRVTLPVGHWVMGEAPDAVLQTLRTAFA